MSAIIKKELLKKLVANGLAAHAEGRIELSDNELHTLNVRMEEFEIEGDNGILYQNLARLVHFGEYRTSGVKGFNQYAAQKRAMDALVAAGQQENALLPNALQPLREIPLVRFNRTWYAIVELDLALGGTAKTIYRREEGNTDNWEYLFFTTAEFEPPVVEEEADEANGEGDELTFNDWYDEHYEGEEAFSTALMPEYLEYCQENNYTAVPLGQ